MLVSVAIAADALTNAVVILFDPAISLARLLHEKGNLTEAEFLYREAVRAFEKRPKRNSPQLAEAQSNLAEILAQTGNLNEAKALMIETLKQIGSIEVMKL